MQLTRISIPVTVEERESLRTLAQNELRDPREQVRYLLQQELIKRGILPVSENNKSATGKVLEAKTVNAFAVANP